MIHLENKNTQNSIIETGLKKFNSLFFFSNSSANEDQNDDLDFKLDMLLPELDSKDPLTNNQSVIIQLENNDEEKNELKN